MVWSGGTDEELEREALRQSGKNPLAEEQGGPKEIFLDIDIAESEGEKDEGERE